MTRGEFLTARTGMRILAHRGLALSAPENTLAAFQDAADAGADVIETDVHASSDGVCVISHDPVIRTGSGGVSISATPAATIAEVGLGGDEHVPTLYDALVRFPSMRFNIDVKARRAVEPAVRAVSEAGAVSRVLMTSFDEKTRAAVVSRLPGVATSASARMIMGSYPWLVAGDLKRLSTSLAGVDAVQIPLRKVVPLVGPWSVRRFHRAGVEVHVWTVNDPDIMRRLRQWGVDGVVTDRCDVAYETIGAGRREP